MRPVSDAFLRTVRGSHRMIAEAWAVAPGQTGVEPTGVPLTIEAGDVRLDATTDVHATLDLTVAGAGMWPERPTDPLAPYGQEIFVRRGIDYGNGTREWVSLGYFRIESPEQPKAPSGPIRITGRDRMQGLIDARLLAPRAFSASATYGQVVSALVREVYPWASIEWDDSTNDEPIGRAVVVEEDRYGFLDETITSTGKVWEWDHRGVLVIRTPAETSDPVFDVDHGEGGVLIDMSRRLSREGVYNAVVSIGEGADTLTPTRAIAIDDDPRSPTYWYGSFGQVPKFFNSPLLTTASRAQSASRTLLRKGMGVPYAVDFSAVPNPALAPFDPIRVRYPGRSEAHVIDRLTIPLVSDRPMSGVTRVQSSAGIRIIE